MRASKGRNKEINSGPGEEHHMDERVVADEETAM